MALYEGTPVVANHGSAHIPADPGISLGLAGLIHGLLGHHGGLPNTFEGIPNGPSGTYGPSAGIGGIHSFGGPPGSPIGGAAPAPGILDGFFQHLLGGLPQQHGSLASYLEHARPQIPFPHQGPLMAPEHAVHVVQQNVIAHLLQAIQNINRAQNPDPGLPPREVAIQ